MRCQEVVELVTDFLTGELDAERNVRVAAHLAECIECETHVDQIRETVRILGRVDGPTLGDEACAELVRAFRDWK